MGLKIRKYLPPLTVLLFRNSTNFAKVNTSEINQNALIAKISICKKTSKFPKYIKKDTFKLFFKKFSTKKTATVLYLLDICLKMKVHKMLDHQTNVYVPDPTISSILHA